MNDIDFTLRSDFITLDALLKAAGLVGSGGAARQPIAGGAVRVDGVAEVRRGAKIRAGQRVEFAGSRIHLRAASGSSDQG